MDPFITPAVLETMQIIGMHVDICLFGMPKSGKTTFVNALNNEFGKSPIPTTEITKIKIKKRKIDQKNYRITIYDTSGEREHHSENVESLMNIVDSIGNNLNPFSDFLLMFFCNIKDFVDNSEYRQQVNSRLKHINSVINDRIIDRKKFLLVFTMHEIAKTQNLSKQEKENRENLEKKMNSYFMDKEYGDYIKFYLDTSDEKSVGDLLAYIPLLFPFYHTFA